MPAVGTKGYEEFTPTGAKDVERERNLNQESLELPFVNWAFGN